MQAVVGHLLAPLDADGGRQRLELGQRRPGRLGPGLDATEVPLHEGEPLLRLDVAAQREDGVVRGVVATEEGVHVLEPRAEVLHRPDRRVVVRVPLGEDGGVDVDERGAVRLVVVPLALLLLDDVALVVEVLLGQRVEEVGVPVGLEPERELEGALGHVSK